jgi:hypothetical protein
MGKTKMVSHRVNMLWRGEELAFLREVQTLFRLNDENAAIRFLCARGHEALCEKLANERMRRRLEAQYAPQEVLPLFEKMERRAAHLAGSGGPP